MKILIVFFLFILLINQLIRCSNWFKEKYADVIRIRASKGNYSIVALGSNQTNFGIDFQDVLFANNWAMGPQSLHFDYLLTKERVCKIKDEGKLIIVISPFVSMLKNYSKKGSLDKYYLVLSKRNIPNYSFRQALKMGIGYYFPFLFLFLNPRQVKQVLRRVFSPNCLENTLMDEKEMLKDAQRWIDGWLKQFDMQCLDMPLADKHKEAIIYNQGVLSDLIQLCKEHRIVPYFAILPVTNYLSSYFTEEVQKKLIFDLIAPFRSEVQLLNYFKDPRFLDNTFYFNSFFLNARGRKELTKNVLLDTKQ